MSNRRVPLAIVFPAASALLAMWATLPCLVIWFHVVTGKPYDLFSGALGGEIFVAGFLSIVLAMAAAVSGYPRVAPWLVLWAVAAMLLVVVGVQVVREVPEERDRRTTGARASVEVVSRLYGRERWARPTAT